MIRRLVKEDNNFYDNLIEEYVDLYINPKITNTSIFKDILIRKYKLEKYEAEIIIPAIMREIRMIILNNSNKISYNVGKDID